MRRLLVGSGIAVAVGLMVCISALGQGGAAEKPKAGDTAAEPSGPKRVDLPEGIVARVNGKDIKKIIWMERCFKRMLPQIRLQALQEIMNEMVVRQEAEKNKVTVTDKDVTEEIENIKVKQWPKLQPEQRNAVFKEALARGGLNLEAMKKQVKVQLTLLKLVSKEIKVNDEDIKKAFDAQYGPKVRISHILHNSEEAAQKTLARIKSKKDTFSKMVEVASLDPTSAANGGRLADPVHHGYRYPEIEKAAFALKKKGDISGVVKTGVGYHIIRLDQKLPASKVKLADVRDDMVARVKRAMT
ncbi:MAG: peptidylprolyl isomerase, partial [Phycisphaerae bacterium]|nr:peptidylprolyl isomerase [Phycisphaerae bacterium]